MFIPKKIIYALVVIAILAIGISIGWLARSTPPTSAALYPSKVEQAAQGGQSAAVQSAPGYSYIPPSSIRRNGTTGHSTNVGISEDGQATPSPVAPSSAKGGSSFGGKEGETGRVTRVIDGDTIEVEMNGKVEPVRYIGIDTPETVDPRKPVQCFGVEALKKNKELVEGAVVRLERDITDRDKYNRLLRYVYITPQINVDTGTLMNPGSTAGLTTGRGADNSDEVFVNLALVEQGFTKSYSYPPDIKYQDRIVAAEKKAREDKLGLWTACVSATPAVSEAPGAAASAAASNPSCAIKGNISTSGEKIYHLQGCGSYAKTVIDENRGERWFCSEQDAESAGWRKALNCS